MNIWPHFSKHRCKNPVDVTVNVSGSKRDNGPHMVDVTFTEIPSQDDVDERILKAEMTVIEAHRLARRLVSIWGAEAAEYPKELTSPTPVEVLIAALQEAYAWMPGGDRTPARNGAKCQTLNEARELVEKVLGGNR